MDAVRLSETLARWGWLTTVVPVLLSDSRAAVPSVLSGVPASLSV